MESKQDPWSSSFAFLQSSETHLRILQLIRENVTTARKTGAGKRKLMTDWQLLLVHMAQLSAFRF